VSAERFAQWVIEDVFAQGRPAIERVGAEFTNDIDAYERIKLGRHRYRISRFP